MFSRFSVDLSVFLTRDSAKLKLASFGSRYSLVSPFSFPASNNLPPTL